jgi:hypothetical protein
MENARPRVAAVCAHCWWRAKDVLSALSPVYVSYQGGPYGFTSLAQLGSDGYARTAAVPVPSTRRLNVQPYSRS